MVYLVILMDLEPLDLEFFISVNEAGLWLVDLKLLLCCVGFLALDLGCMDSLLVLTCCGVLSECGFRN